MNNQNALLIIDPQFDFCNPKGTLYIAGADADMNRLAQFIHSNSSQIDHIIISLDSHPVNDISHPSFWYDADGNHPNPFTAITLQDIKDNIWIPRYFAEEATKYISDLESQGEFAHYIWPYHCLQGSQGASIDDSIMDELLVWSLNGKQYQIIEKGTHPLTEHFGIFRANVPISGCSETQLNQELIESLSKYQHIYLAGEAKSHCVANSLKQLMDVAPLIANRIIILEDCMSNVANLEHLGDPIYKKAKSMGIEFVKSTDIYL